MPPYPGPSRCPDTSLFLHLFIHSGLQPSGLLLPAPSRGLCGLPEPPLRPSHCSPAHSADANSAADTGQHHRGSPLGSSLLHSDRPFAPPTHCNSPNPPARICVFRTRAVTGKGRSGLDRRSDPCPAPALWPSARHSSLRALVYSSVKWGL